ncbi:hypothetical protein ACXYTJ_12585 [Gilvimarinus sp. F26214L]|uniref:hypothetical protein n=1 Tax=Gilvimarinus sp. DZF01 TaxID=3461371 RepID=UPI0040452F99
MMSSQEYLLSWGLYLLGCLGLMLVWWKMTGWVRIPLVRNILRISALATLLMPYPVPGQESFLAPALMMTFVEGLFYEDLGFSHAGIPLLITIVLANIIYLIVDLATQPFRRKRDSKAGEASAGQGDSSERKTPTLGI